MERNLQEGSLFLPRTAERHPSKIKMQAKQLCTKFATMHEGISIIEDYNNRETLKYFSNVFLESKPIITLITCYVVENGYSGLNKKVDEYIFTSEKIFGLLKILHERFINNTPVPEHVIEPEILDPQKYHPTYVDWVKYNQMANKEIINTIGMLIERVY